MSFSRSLGKGFDWSIKGKSIPLTYFSDYTVCSGILVKYRHFTCIRIGKKYIKQNPTTEPLISIMISILISTIAKTVLRITYAMI